MSVYSWKDIIVSLDNASGSTARITSAVNSHSLSGLLNMLDKSGMDATNHGYLSGLAGATVNLNGFLNSTTEALFGPLQGARTSITKTFGLSRGSRWVWGEVWPGNVQLSDSVDGLGVWSAELTFDNGAGTTYYVDATAGNDNNNGLTTATAWQTIGKLNASTFYPGDQILFKRGETWTGADLVVPSSGASGNPIIFGAYGTGALPIIQGASTACIDIAAGKNYLTFQYLNLDANNAIDYCARIFGAYIEFNDCEAKNGVSANFIAYTAAPHHLTFARNNIHDCAGFGGITTAVDSPITDVLIEDNTFTDNGTNVSLHHGIYLREWSNVTIRRNTVTGSSGHGIVSAGPSSNVYIYQNDVSGNNTGIWVAEGGTSICTNYWIYNNKCYGQIGEYGSGIYVQTGVTGSIYIYNNTCANQYAGIWLSPGVTGAVVKNNIVHTGANEHAVVVGNLAVVQNNTFNYNLYYRPGSTDRCTVSDPYDMKTLAEWQALTGSPDANSLAVDPEFTTEFTNLHLQSTSDAIGAGETGLGITTDYDDVARGAAVDLGCYEYVA